MIGPNKKIVIGWAKTEEWRPAIMMVWKTFMDYDAPDYEAAGVRAFFEFVSDDDLYDAFRRGTYQLLVARDGDRIVGVASVRNGSHLSLLFVDGEYHRLGLARKMLNLLEYYLVYEEGENTLSVNSSPYAVGFYQKCGFTALDTERVDKGIRYTPMRKFLLERRG